MLTSSPIPFEPLRTTLTSLTRVRNLSKALHFHRAGPGKSRPPHTLPQRFVCTGWGKLSPLSSRAIGPCRSMSSWSTEADQMSSSEPCGSLAATLRAPAFRIPLPWGRRSQITVRHWRLEDELVPRGPRCVRDVGSTVVKARLSAISGSFPARLLEAVILLQGTLWRASDP